jgi:photosystem II stability/assembly factor-like uncharacterized protein
MSEHPLEPGVIGFANANRGWMGVGSTLYRTTDGGRSWQRQEDLDGAVEAIRFETPEQGRVETASSVYRTADGGGTWAREALPALPSYGEPCQGFDQTRVSFVSRDRGWALCTIMAGAGSQVKAVFATRDGGDTWEKVAWALPKPGGGVDQQGLGIGGYADQVRFIDRQTGFLGYSRGGLTVTHDGGHTWQGLPVPPGGELFVREIDFLSPQTGFVVISPHGKPLLLATRDGGQTWEQRFPALAPDAPLPLALLDASTWLAGGPTVDPGAVLRTADAGRTWEKVGHLPADRVVGMRFLSPTEGYASAWRYSGNMAPELYRTEDGGKTWAPADPGALPPPLQGWLNGQDFADEHTAWRVAAPGTLQATGDGGQTWQTLPVDDAIISFDLLPGGVGWAVGRQGTGTSVAFGLLSTSDGGQTWTRFDLGKVQPFQVRFADADHGLLQADGQLYLTEDGGHSWRQIR